MIVFISGMPRAGSMWTYNVTRNILEMNGYTTLPQKQQADERRSIMDAIHSAPRDRQTWCIKTHLNLTNNMPTRHSIKLICNYRDVRDAMLSYMRFEKCSFEQALHVMKHGMMDLTDYYFDTFDDDMMLKLRYEDLVSDNVGAIKNIAQFLDLNLPDKKSKCIADKWSRDNVHRKILELNKVQVDNSGTIKGARNQSRYTTVKNPSKGYRIIEKSTGFQTSHITSKGNAEWRDVFSDKEVSAITEISKEWLDRYGYV